MVALSESDMESGVKRPLAEKSQWRHIWFAKNLIISETMQRR